MVKEGDRSKIPDYRIYRVEDAPELQEIQDALQSKGLKDPWMRNEVWRYLPSEWGTHRQRLLTFFFRGFRLGFGAFLATIALESAWKLAKGSGGGGHGGHDDGHGGGIDKNGDDGRSGSDYNGGGDSSDHITVDGNGGVEDE